MVSLRQSASRSSTLLVLFTFLLSNSMVWGLVRASSAARASISSRYSSRGGGLTAFASHWGQQRSVETAPTSRLLASYAGETDEELMNSGYKRLGVNWYPGHIAKAERQLSETLKAVDVVVEVRDARVCKASSHPKVGEWCAGRPRIVVLTHLDMIPRPAANAWRRSYELFGAERWDDAPINTQVSNQAKQAQQFRVQFAPQENSKVTSTNIVTPVEQVLFVNAKQGQGIHALHRAIFKAGAHVQERRDRRGLKERPLRVGIIGYPNVGKSALINRILGRKRAKTANTPGVTRSLQWIRVRTDESKTSHRKEFELLDSPGIIPAKMVDQSDAVLLAACNCIGTNAYDNQAVAAYLCEWLKAVHLIGKGNTAAPQWREKCKERYAFDPLDEVEHSDGVMGLRTGEDMLFKVADNCCRGDPEDAARKILQDFRTGRIGPICLQVAPEQEDDNGQMAVPVGAMDGKASPDVRRQRQEDILQMAQERGKMALETAKERGLVLPEVVDEDDVGKGMFEGW